MDINMLLHCCCFACSIISVDCFKGEGYKLNLFWYNPNIHPYKEYKARLEAFKVYEKEQGLKVHILDFYGLRYFIGNLNGKFNDRCTFCYKDRLFKTAKFAKEKGFNYFSTTLLYSPYQDHEKVKQIGQEAAKREGIFFVYKDLRLKFKQGQKQARATGLYMQKYCGCIFSEQERYLKEWF